MFIGYLNVSFCELPIQVSCLLFYWIFSFSILFLIAQLEDIVFWLRNLYQEGWDWVMLVSSILKSCQLIVKVSPENSVKVCSFSELFHLDFLSSMLERSKMLIPLCSCLTILLCALPLVVIWPWWAVRSRMAGQGALRYETMKLGEDLLENRGGGRALCCA